MKTKKIVIYSTGLIIATFIGSVLGYLIKKPDKTSGTLNIFYEDSIENSELFLKFNSSSEVLELCEKKKAVFDVKLIKVGISELVHAKDKKIS